MLQVCTSLPGPLMSYKLVLALDKLGSNRAHRSASKSGTWMSAPRMPSAGHPCAECSCTTLLEGPADQASRKIMSSPKPHTLQRSKGTEGADGESAPFWQIHEHSHVRAFPALGKDCLLQWEITSHHLQMECLRCCSRNSHDFFNFRSFSPWPRQCNPYSAFLSLA